MPLDSHVKGSVRSQNQKKENAKAIGLRNMKDEEFVKEMIEIKLQLDVLMEIIQKEVEDKKCRQIFKKKFKWIVKELFARKLQKKMRHMISTFLK